MKRVLVIAALPFIGACTEITNAANRASDNTRAAIYNTATRIQGYTRYEPEELQPVALESSYCYNADSDVICYSAPQPQLSNKLLGQQGYAAPVIKAQNIHAATAKKPLAAIAVDADAPTDLMPRY